MTALLLLIGINFAVALDAVGNVPFLRAVHVYERPQMTAVYRTNLDLSDLLPAFVYSIILAFTGLGGVFVALGIFSGGLRLAVVAASAALDVVARGGAGRSKLNARGAAATALRRWPGRPARDPRRSRRRSSCSALDAHSDSSVPFPSIRRIV